MLDLIQLAMVAELDAPMLAHLGGTVLQRLVQLGSQGLA